MTQVIKVGDGRIMIDDDGTVTALGVNFERVQACYVRSASNLDIRSLEHSMIAMSNGVTIWPREGSVNNFHSTPWRAIPPSVTDGRTSL